MPRKPHEQTISLARGGFGLLEIGVIKATLVSRYTVGKKVIEVTRYRVQMDNKRGPFNASMRFTFGTAELVMDKAA